MYWPVLIGGGSLCVISLLVAWLLCRGRRAESLRIVGDLRDVEIYLLKRLHAQDPTTRRTLARGDVDPASVAARLSDLVRELAPRERNSEDIANADTIELGST